MGDKSFCLEEKEQDGGFRLKLLQVGENGGEELRSSLLSPNMLFSTDKADTEKTNRKNSRIRKVSHLISSTSKENKNMSYQELRDLVSQIQLFKDKSVIKKEEDRQDLIDEICGIIKFEEFTQGKRVFRFGDYGDKFYIICKGTVSVHIPIKVSAETIESSPAKKKLIEVAQLQKGQCFGDMALIDYKPRSATIKCITDCFFAVVSKQDYKKIVGKLYKKIRERIHNLIRGVPYFADLKMNDLKKLSAYFEEIEYIRNNTIIKQNEQADNVYLVKEGEFEVLKLINYTQPRNTSNDKILHKSKLKYQLAKVGQLGVGKIFGDQDAVCGRPYSFTIKCHSTTGTCLQIKTHQLIKAIEEIDEEILEVIKSWAENEKQGLTRYLNKNREFEDNSKFINKFKNHLDKIEEMKRENESPLQKRIAQRNMEDQQLRSRDDSQPSPKKTVPYVKVSSINFQSNKDISHTSHFKRDTLVINDDDISMKLNKSKRVDFSGTSLNTKTTSFNQKRDTINMRPSLVMSQINKEMPSELRSKIRKLNTTTKSFIEDSKILKCKKSFKAKMKNVKTRLGFRSPKLRYPREMYNNSVVKNYLINNFNDKNNFASFDSDRAMAKLATTINSIKSARMTGDIMLKIAKRQKLMSSSPKKEDSREFKNISIKSQRVAFSKRCKKKTNKLGMFPDPSRQRNRSPNFSSGFVESVSFNIKPKNLRRQIKRNEALKNKFHFSKKIIKSNSPERSNEDTLVPISLQVWPELKSPTSFTSI
ncbi:unnamed protein product [Moneuplotes crassus]|uniref:Cyclic nucleotide-binding domain-containing protein n=1 Tax=Euplotes crassus TaxID=5936 RepID=A0AAD2D278_EUPCR|nr:unnamed protein product [Moneuplotes crassus]